MKPGHPHGRKRRGGPQKRRWYEGESRRQLVLRFPAGRDGDELFDAIRSASAEEGTNKTAFVLACVAEKVGVKYDPPLSGTGGLRVTPS